MPFAQINGKQLYYLSAPAHQASRQQGLTLLFLHGLGSSSSFYATVIPALVKQGLSCVALDTYGSGLSKYTGQEQHIGTIYEDAEQLLSSLGIDPTRTIVVGHSMGCIVASELASRVTVAGLVLIGAIRPNIKYHEVFKQRIATVETQGMESMADIIPTAATGSRSHPLHHAFIRALLLSQTPQGYASLCGAIISATAPDYSRIRCPVMVVAGSEDKTAGLGDSHQIMSELGTSDAAIELHILDRVGHWHCIEAPDEVAELLTNFARKLETSRGQR